MFLNKDCLHVFYQDPLNFSGDPTKVFASKYSILCLLMFTGTTVVFKAPTGFMNTAFTRKRNSEINSLVVVHPWARNAFNILIRCAPLSLLCVGARSLARAVCMSAMMRLSPRNPPAIIHPFVYQSDKERRERHAGGRVDTRLYDNYKGIQIFGEN